MILYALYVDAIFFPCHPYIWSTTVLHNDLLYGASDEPPHATDIAEQNPVYENAQPEIVASPVYEVISQV